MEEGKGGRDHFKERPARGPVLGRQEVEEVPAEAEEGVDGAEGGADTTSQPRRAGAEHVQRRELHAAEKRHRAG